MPAFLRKYNTLLVTGTTAIRIPIVKRGAVDFAVGADWTPAAGDVKILIDGAAAANVTNLPTAVACGNTAVWEFVLTAAELSSKQSTVTIADATTKVVEDQSFIVETFGNASAMYQADLSAANLPANVTQLLGTAWLTPGTAGTPDVNAKLIGGTAQTAGDVPAKTNSLTFTGANKVDASVRDINGVATTAVTTVKAVVGLTTADVIASVTGAVGSVTGAVGSVGAGGIAAASFAAGAVDASALATDAIGASELAQGAVDKILDTTTNDSAITVRMALRLLIAVLGGKCDGGGTATMHYRDVADLKNVVTATVDANGNRSAVTLSI